MNKQEEDRPQREQISTVQENDPGKLQQLGMLLVSPGLDEERLSEKMISKIKKSKDIERNQKLLISKLSQKEEDHTGKPPTITISSAEKTVPFKPPNHSLKRKRIPPALNFSDIQSPSQLHASKSAPPNITRFPRHKSNLRVRYMGRLAPSVQDYSSPITNSCMTATYPYPYTGLPSVPYYPYISTPTHSHPYEGYYSMYPNTLYNGTVTSADHQAKRKKATGRSAHLDDLTSRKRGFISRRHHSGDSITSKIDRDTECPVTRHSLSEDASLNDDADDYNDKERSIIGEISLYDDVFKFEVCNDKDDYMKACEKIWNEWHNLKR
ncbi:hypothetical protein SMKI_04G6750 [Saccharomyces mikatae IFO 1815]|uniref:Dig2p n=1 Tax=Saccharomyces mikatae IFO 1815 TaxID=226126 RepID=A0AA35IYR2_SACMI|nr:uncharacterized protein SMKI_04G6750 [Saccharomyces mikatae IFO 1815]CAI4038331.1 hypothetical protein SMKI_04G6750 [Saccharomyces mikatae IFO 1815]